MAGIWFFSASSRATVLVCVVRCAGNDCLLEDTRRLLDLHKREIFAVERDVFNRLTVFFACFTFFNQFFISLSFFSACDSLHMDELSFIFTV